MGSRAVLPRLLTMAALSLAFLTPTASSGTLIHKAAPPFVRTGLNGQRVALTAARGHVVLLTFWATWCVPCQVEMPRFVDWQTRYGPQGLQIIGVSMDDEESLVRALTAQSHVNYQVLMGDAKLAKLYGGILGLPVTFLIDRHGKIAAKFKGETELNSMEQSIRALLDKR